MNKTIRKIRKREGRGRYILPLLFFFWLFAFIMSSFREKEIRTLQMEDKPGQVWVLKKHFWGKEQIEIEEYLVGMMASTIPAQYEPETLKAQAIILRSFCMTQMKKENGKKVIHDDIIKNYYIEAGAYEDLWKENHEQYETRIRQAVQETQGIILVCDGDIINPPFFRISNGATRDISEYIYSKHRFPYLKSVSCKEDIMANEYIQYVEMPEKEFKKRLQQILGKKEDTFGKLILYKDKKGYVKEVKVNENVIQGETFRKIFDLASSSFSIQKINSVIEIQTKGLGHGFGFSQWEANCLAKEGKRYEDLLFHFYQNITLEKI